MTDPDSDELEQLRAALDEALERIAELEQTHRRKDEFLAVLGHELRNPLAALTNGLMVLEHVCEEPETIRRIHPMLVRQTRRMTVMLDQLLDISRVCAGKMQLDEQIIDLVEVAIAAVEAVQPMIDLSGHDLRLALPGAGELFVRGDFVRLIQVVENLLANAAKYTEEGGTIWLSLDALTVDGERHARIRVRDNGLGIDPALLERVFDSFMQGSHDRARSRGGLGLGLPLVRLLVEMHGGEVGASSEGPGLGSEFTVLLPEIEVEAPARRQRPRSAGHLDAIPPQRVLIVDDEQDPALSLLELLESHGHEARTAHDARTALDIAASFEPDLVLLDLGLPDTDGYELARALREARPTLRIVAVTGFQREDERLRAAGIDDHLLKPPTLERLIAVMSPGS